MEDFAVAPIHVGHVNGVAIRPVDFSVHIKSYVASIQITSTKAEALLHVKGMSMNL